MANKEIPIPGTPGKPQPQPSPQTPQAKQPEISIKEQVETSNDLSKAIVDLSAEAKGATTPDELIDLLIKKAPDDLLPWEKVPLPSKGLYYDSRIPGGIVEVRPMGLHTDKILATARLAQTGQAIDYVYKNCIRFPDKSFDPADLLVGDRMFLLFYLRGITHGNMYEFQITCSNDDCKKQSLHEYDFNKLAENIKYPKFQKEPIKINLPYFTKITQRDIWVEARFMRGRDVTVMLKKQKFAEKMKGSVARSARTGVSMGTEEINLDTTIEENLNLLIVTANGVNDRHKIQQVIDRMHAQDTAVIRETLRDAEPGIDTRIIITCPDCGNEMRIDLPITESFFRPTEPRGVRS